MNRWFYCDMDKIGTDRHFDERVLVDIDTRTAMLEIWKILTKVEGIILFSWFGIDWHCLNYGQVVCRVSLLTADKIAAYAGVSTPTMYRIKKRTLERLSKNQLLKRYVEVSNIERDKMWDTNDGTESAL